MVQGRCFASTRVQNRRREAGCSRSTLQAAPYDGAHPCLVVHHHDHQRPNNCDLSSPLRADECTVVNVSAIRVRIPDAGTEADVNKPARIAPHHLFGLRVSIDDLPHTDRAKLRLRVSVLHLTNKDAL